MQNSDTFKKRVIKENRVTRYFQGKAPQWAEDKSAEDVVITIDRQPEGVITSAAADRRLARLATSTAPIDGDISATRRRRIYEAKVIEEEEAPGSDDDVLGSANIHENQILEGDAPLLALLEKAEEDEEDEILARRSRTMQKLSNKQNLDDFPKKSEKEESESEYETDSDEYTDEEEDQQVLKPVFVPKAKRETIKDEDAKKAEEELLESKKLLELEERKKRTRILVAESIRREEERQELQAQPGADSDGGLPDDTDDADDEDEYESWKLREMTRMKRDAEERERHALEKADVERRRGMTQQERDDEDRKRGEGRYKTKEKSKWRFMQKYYHKGVFYMDESSVKQPDDVRKLDFNAPTLEDKFDKEKLPKVLQVKNFGRRGRTKYTHLTDQDTTRLDDSLRPDETLQTKYLNKRAGVGDIEAAAAAKRNKL